MRTTFERWFVRRKATTVGCGTNITLMGVFNSMLWIYRRNGEQVIVEIRFDSVLNDVARLATEPERRGHNVDQVLLNGRNESSTDHTRGKRNDFGVSVS